MFSPDGTARQKGAKAGSPATRRNIRALVLRLASENHDSATAGSIENWPGWGTSPGIDSMGDLEKCGHRSRAAAERAGVVAVPALPGRGDRGVRLLHSRPS